MLHVAIAYVGDGNPSTHVHPINRTAWGSFSLTRIDEPAELALDPDVIGADTTELLVVVAPRDVEKVRVAVATVGAIRPELITRIDVLDMPPQVAYRVVESLQEVAGCAPTIHAHLVASVRVARWGAWLPSVTKLEQPAPGMALHLRSLFAKGSGFLAVQGDQGWVTRLPLTQADPSWRFASPGVHHWDATSFGELPEVVIAALFSLGIQTRPNRRDLIAPLSANWGHPRAVEFVILAAPPTELGAAWGQCASCREAVFAEHCPFCRNAVSPAHTSAHQGVFQ